MKKKSFTIRLDLSKEGDKKAWNYLEGMDKQKYRSYSQVVSLAINEFFQKPTHTDSLTELRAVIREELEKIQVIPSQVSPQELPCPDSEEDDISALLDFVDSF